jgi:hypothetical protein
MMLDDASRGGPGDGVMACDVTHDPTGGRAFQTAFGGSDPWKRGEGCGDQESDHDVAHMKLLRATVVIKPLSRRKVAATLSSLRWR